MSERPNLLMISHCVPEEAGDSDQRQAWRLLSRLSRTHGISLICLMGAPVRLAQWRVVFSRVDRMVILHRGVLPRAHRGADRRVAQTIGMWRETCRFDAVVATHPRLWSAARLSGAPQRVCDFSGADSGEHRRRAAEAQEGVKGMGSRWWHQRLGAVDDAYERSVARQCDMIIVNNYDEVRHYGTEPCDIAVTVDSLDLAARREAIPARPALPLAA